MSQEHLAKAAGVSVRTVIRAEGGHRIQDENMRGLCSVLGLQADEVAAPARASATLDDAALVEAMASPSDTPGQARDVRILCEHASAAVPGIRLALRSDIVAVRREHARRQGLPFAPESRRYMSKVLLMWLGLYVGACVAAHAFYYGWEFLVAPVGEGGNLFLVLMMMLFMLIASVTGVVSFMEEIRHLRLVRTIHVLDATHLHEFRLVRLSHRPKDDPPIVQRRSYRLDGVRSVRRTDFDGHASFSLDTADGRIHLPCVCLTAEASAVERAVSRPGLRPVNANASAAVAAVHEAGMGMA